MNTNKYHVIRVGELVDISGDPPESVASASFTVDPFSDDDPRVKYEQVLSIFTNKLPLGLKDLNYFMMYYNDGTWVVFDIDNLPTPRSWEDLALAAGVNF